MVAFDTARATDRLRDAGAAEPMAQAIAETIRDAVAPLPAPDEIVTRSVLEAVLDAKFAVLDAKLAVLETKWHTDLHAQTRWIVTFGVALAAVVVAAVGGLVAALV